LTLTFAFDEGVRYFRYSLLMLIGLMI